MKQLGIIILLIRSSYLIIWPHHTLSINSFKIDLKYLPVSFEEAPGLPCSSYEEHKKSGNWLYHPKVISVSRYSLILKSLFLNHEGSIGVHFTPRLKFFFIYTKLCGSSTERKILYTIKKCRLAVISRFTVSKCL